MHDRGAVAESDTARLPDLIMPNYWLVFDVESVGLHGEGFAVAWVVVDSAGRECEARLEACPSSEAQGTPSGRAWVRGNCPDLPVTRATPQEVRQEFWRAWLHWKDQGAVMVADYGWPVETRFLAACVDDVRSAATSGETMADSARDFEGPFPLHELASLLIGSGAAPQEHLKRLPRELPEHDPLADTRHSVRLLLDVTKGS
jgi:hypothetical protein